MNTFFALNREEQIARLDALVSRVADSFALHSYTNNAIYRVIKNDRVCALRIHRPGLKQKHWIQSELDFLHCLKRDTSLNVPTPYEMTESELEGFPVDLVWFEWLDGQTIPVESLTLDQVAQIGRFAAELHNYSATLPPTFDRPSLDWEGLFGENSPYNPGDGAAIFTADQRAVMDEVAALVRAVMARQHEAGFGMIHADLRPQNLLWNGDQLAVVDFDDCAYGYFLYDLAPSLLFFKPDPRYDEMRAALIEGYASLRDIENRQDLETLIAGRYVASCRWVAGHPGMRDRAPEIIAGRIADLKRFLNTGAL